MGDRQLSDPKDWADKHGDYLYRCAMLRVRDAGLAEEVVQETFLAALQAGERFAGGSSERSWMVGILKHKIIDHFRKQSREGSSEDLERVVVDLDEHLFDAEGYWKSHAVGPKNWPNDPSAALEQKQFWEVLKRCLSELPPKMAQVFSLREVDELSSDEVCATLDITSSNLWVLLHRARKHLRGCLEKHHFTGARQFEEGAC